MYINQFAGNNIRMLRTARKSTQEALAFDANISVSCLSAVERGLKNCTLATLNKIAVALHVSPAVLVMEPDAEREESPPEIRLEDFQPDLNRLPSKYQEEAAVMIKSILASYRRLLDL